MYGKLFAQMYDGTLATEGPWEALVTFQQFIILADKDGVVDMTSEAISRRTTIPFDIISTGIKALEQPDVASRSPDEEGRRIVRLSDGREWGWRIVNYIHYRNIRSQEERREYMRNYQRKRRSKDKDVNSYVNNVSNVNQSSKQYAEAEAITTLSGKPDISLDKKNNFQKEAKETLLFLNEKTGKNYQPVKANIELIIARLQEGYTVVQLRQVVAKKFREWKSDEKMAQYLRPKTLFNRSNFANYAGELVSEMP